MFESMTSSNLLALKSINGKLDFIFFLFSFPWRIAGICWLMVETEVLSV